MKGFTHYVAICSYGQVKKRSQHQILAELKLLSRSLNGGRHWFVHTNTHVGGSTFSKLSPPHLSRDQAVNGPGLHPLIRGFQLCLQCTLLTVIWQLYYLITLWIQSAYSTPWVFIVYTRRTAVFTWGGGLGPGLDLLAFTDSFSFTKQCECFETIYTIIANTNKPGPKDGWMRPLSNSDEPYNYFQPHCIPNTQIMWSKFTGGSFCWMSACFCKWTTIENSIIEDYY